MVKVRSRSATINEEKDFPESLEEPQSEPVSREIRIAGSQEDSSIAIIENPSLEGYIGILLSREFYQRFHWRELIDVQHARVDGKYAVKELNRYDRVRIDKRFDPILCNFVAADRKVLPAPRRLPYEICFISNSEYYRFKIMLQNNNIKEVVDSIYELFAKKFRHFL